ncbi:hypothetical protein CHLNCDRAFT_139311 [Chlorella variabilis]|uniref:PWWP domain-containing protein n=1 Tax=Chlorella variabilis TaxID=554065 RepID=E1ZPZ6_CHLVA|nr:hypothetical protein CHLNCDRAFT_139311 [Chlorella variabilis]EFN52066.1 hypothetical protein CHLNCDRAFT_139311 [Chlorella variabilis]|eukprot:XP_005844168.1 hypothetical protein CHLNCDRAFT_139311 [Chlorella variabilis]
MDPQLQPDLSLKATTEGGRLPGGSWRQDGGSEQQEVAALSPGGGAALSDSPGRPFSPSSAEASPKVVAAARGESVLPAMKGLRSVHIQPPGKHPYPDDQTPEAESVRAQLQPQQPRAGAREGRADGPYAGTGAELEAANPRSVLAQPPGKQPHPDDPAFGQQQEEEQQQQEQREGQASQHAQLHMGHLGATVKPLAPWRLQQPGPQQSGGSSGAAKPKQASTKPGTSGQRKSGGTAGSTAAGAGLPGIPAGSPQFRPGDVVWAKIGNYPWWPAQLQRPSTEDHIKPKHSSSDLFCVFYDYSKHANVKNKALQRAVDEAWVYGMQRPRPDWKAAP